MKKRRFAFMLEEKDGEIRFEVWQDKETGVNYLISRIGITQSVTPLLDSNGSPYFFPFQYEATSE